MLSKPLLSVICPALESLVQKMAVTPVLTPPGTVPLVRPRGARLSTVVRLGVSALDPPTTHVPWSLNDLLSEFPFVS